MTKRRKKPARAAPRKPKAAAAAPSNENTAPARPGAAPVDARALLVEASALHQRGDVAGAERRYRAVLARSPEHFDALHLLGVVRAQAGKAREAVELISRAVRLRPRVAEAHNNLGSALKSLKRSAEAIECYRRAIALNPNYAEAHRNLANALLESKRAAEAIGSFEKALALKPGAAALCDLGRALRGAGRDAQALEAYRKAVAGHPRHVPGHLGVGDMHYLAGRHREALESFARAVALKPDAAEAHFGMGNALLGLRRTADAVAAYDKALALRKNYPEALNNRGNALLTLGRTQEAAEAYRAAAAARPRFVEAHYHLGNAMRALGRHPEAAASYEAALAIDAGFRYGPGMAANSRAYACDWRDRAQRERRIVESARAGKLACMPLPMLAISGNPADQLACARLYVGDRHPAAAPLWRGERYRHARLRIAYLSADFGDHPVAWLLAELIERHDRGQFDTMGVSFGPPRQGAMRERLRAAFGRFVDAHGKTDAEVAALLRESEIDVAVDLMGHTLHSRPDIFARRAAPVQVNYLGFPGTTGAPYMDYILADRHVIPEGSREFYVEQVAYLPDSYVAGDTTRKAGRAPSRAEAGLPERGFVYCCFHNGYKITPEVFEVWVRLLKAVEGSVLWLSVRDAAAVENLKREAKERGVAPERLHFAKHASQESYLARFGAADLFLDTVPYNAHSTAVDALWGGVPVLTCRGSAFASRVAGSLLHSVGLPELVTESLADYEALAVRLAQRPGELRALRERLAANREKSPLFDTARFARNVESAYRTMWERANRGEPPRSFAVAAITAPGEKPPRAAAAETRNLLADAVARHNRGDLEGAERGYRAILEHDQRHFDALQLLGTARAQAGAAAEGAELLARAIAIRPRVAEAHNNLGYALKALGRDAEAIEAYREAVKLKPDYLDAHRNLSMALLDQKRPGEALASIDDVLAARPGDAAMLCARGDALAGLGRAEEAESAYRDALAARPRFAKAQFGLANALVALKRGEEAVEAYRALAEIDPGGAPVHFNLATALLSVDRVEEAIAALRKAVTLDPGFGRAHHSLGNALHSINRSAEACAAFERAVELEPRSAGAQINLGNARVSASRYADAVAAYRKALEIQPDLVEAHNNLGNTLRMMGHRLEALAHYKKVLALRPDHAYVPGMAVATAADVCEWAGRAERIRAVIDGVTAGAPVTAPFALIGMSADPAVQLACAKTYSAQRFPAAASPLWRGERYRHDRLRVAYLSADFRDHPVSWLIAPLAEAHDRRQFETFAISFTPGARDSMRGRLEGGFEHFLDVRLKSDAEVAALLRESEIDVAVDLMGHTAEARSGICARRAAPVQVNYLGFPGTTGAPYMDYILADRHVIPEGSREFYVEQVAYLPDSYVAGDTTRKAGRAPSRAEAGLPERGFVYCCFHNGYKITPEVFEVWVRLLKAVEGSVLWLSVRDAAAVENLKREAVARAVAPERLRFAKHVSQENYLARFGAADLFLDTLPYNAHSTAVDALWGGVPVLTCRGAGFASRVAGSLLHSVGLPELVTESLADYEALATRLAREPAVLRGLRERLARNREKSPLFDTARFCRHVESAYRAMWERASRGEPPRSFAVEALPSKP